MNKKTVVRVVGWTDGELLRIAPYLPAVWLEQLRHAGLVQVHYVFDLLPPCGVEREAWARQTAERMSSFGFNAVAAPPWAHELCDCPHCEAAMLRALENVCADCGEDYSDDPGPHECRPLSRPHRVGEERRTQ